MVIDNNVNLQQVSNKYQQKNILTKSQSSYQGNPNVVDKTPDKDTVQLSSHNLTNKEKTGIVAIATTAVAITLAVLGRKGYLGKGTQKFLGGKVKEFKNVSHETTEHIKTPTDATQVKQEVNVGSKATAKAEQEAKAKVEQEAKVKVEQEAKAKVEQEAKVKAEQEAKAKAEQEAKTKAEQEARTKAEQEAKLKQEAMVNELPSELKNIRQRSLAIEEVEFNIGGQNTKFEVWKGTQKGSNKGCFVRNLDTGEVFYAKLGGKQSENEILASKLYKLGGIEVPELTSFKLSNGETGLLSKYIPNMQNVYRSNKLVNKGFAMDAFLANWDAVCSGNTLVNGSKAVRIDVGGALDFRARGGKKDFGPVVDEITTLINPSINPEAANIYSTMTREDLIASLQRVADISSVELSHTAPKFSETLIERQDFLKDVLKEIKSTPQEDKSMFEYLSVVKKSVVNKREAVGHTKAPVGTTQAKQETKLGNTAKTKAEQEAKVKADAEAEVKAQELEQKRYNRILKSIKENKEISKQVDDIMAQKDFDAKFNELMDLELNLDGKIVKVKDYINESILGEYTEPVDMLYHGTKSKTAYKNILEDGFSLDAMSRGESGKGIYTGFNKANIEKGYGSGGVFNLKYTGGKVAEVKPGVINDIISNTNFSFNAPEIFGFKFGKGNEIVNEIINRAFIQKIKSHGYDAIHTGYSYNAGTETFIVLDPKNLQIIK